MPGPEPQSLGRLLRRFRLRSALSQDELAARSGVSARTISDLERSQRVSARFETVRLLADALDLSDANRALLIQAAQSPLIDVTLQHHAAGHRSPPGLPAPQSRLIGREREIAEIEEELTSEACRLITLTGPGGVGKTRLALTVADGAAARFPGGVAWVDLSPVRDPSSVMTAIWDGLGVGDIPSCSPGDGLRDLLGEQRVLLVIDNFEHVIAAAPAISALLAANPSLVVLATSRAPLRVAAESDYPVAPLALPPPHAAPGQIQEVAAVQVFAAHARAVQRNFLLSAENAEAVAEICRRLDGLPLAIELAAARVNVLPPRMLLERLEQRLPLLSRGARDSPPRQQTMSNAITWSYNLLDPGAQRLFRLLSVFVGGFTADAVEWVLDARGTNGIGAIDALTTLVESSLVIRAPGSPDGDRFTMFETIREFGIGQLRERAELEHAHNLLASYCQGLARYSDDIPTCVVPVSWLAMVDQERTNIRAAYHHLAQSDDPERLLEFTAAFGHYLYSRGPIQEAWAWCEQALGASASRPTPMRLQVLYWGSHLTSHLGLTDRAAQLGGEALQIAQELGDPGWHAAIIHCLGIIHDARGDVERATALFEEELRLWREAGVLGLSGFAFLFLSGYAFRRGDLARARSLADRATAIFYEMGGLGWVAVMMAMRGTYSISEGDLRQAAAHFLDSLRLSLDQTTAMTHHKGLVGLAFVASELACHETAGQLIGAVEFSLEETGQHLSPFGQALYEQTLVTSRLATGAALFDEARKRGTSARHEDWLRAADAVACAAAERALDHETRRRTAERVTRREPWSLAATG